METKQKAGIGGGVALIAALTGAYTAFHGTHTETTAVSRNDTPVVINRPHDANGSPLPVSIVQPSHGGPPIVIVGHGAPVPCPSPSPTPTPTPAAHRSPTPSPSPTEDCIP